MRTRLLTLLLLLPAVTLPFDSCGLSSSRTTAQKSQEQIHSIDPIDQLVVWETQANLPEFREPTPSVVLESAAVNSSDVATELSPTAALPLKSFINLEQASAVEKVRWVFHPFNTYRKNLFYEYNPSDALRFKGLLTASRSIIFRTPEDNAAYSIKLPTNYPHKASHEPEKLRMNEETLYTLPISNYVRSIDTARGDAPEILPLLDVASVYRRDTNNGYTIRDLRPLQTGKFHYFPAVSIDSAGDALMQAAGIEVTNENRKSFWIKNYVEATGRARALLFLRYGLIQETPNAQNWLIEIKRDTMQPTGRVVVRDLIDTYYSQPYGEKLGHGRIISELEKLGQKPRRRKIDLRSKIIVWQSFLEKEPEAINAHEQSFLVTIHKELRAKQPLDSLAQLEELIKSEPVLEHYSRRNGASPGFKD